MEFKVGQTVYLNNDTKYSDDPDELYEVKITNIGTKYFKIVGHEYAERCKFNLDTFTDENNYGYRIFINKDDFEKQKAIRVIDAIKNYVSRLNNLDKMIELAKILRDCGFKF